MKDAIVKYVIPAIFLTLIGIAIFDSLAIWQNQKDYNAKLAAEYSTACTKIGGRVAHDGHKRVCLK